MMYPTQPAGVTTSHGYPLFHSDTFAAGSQLQSGTATAYFYADNNNATAETFTVYLEAGGNPSWTTLGSGTCVVPGMTYPPTLCTVSVAVPSPRTFGAGERLRLRFVRTNFEMSAYWDGSYNDSRVVLPAIDPPPAPSPTPTPTNTPTSTPTATLPPTSSPGTTYWFDDDTYLSDYMMYPSQPNGMITGLIDTTAAFYSDPFPGIPPIQSGNVTVYFWAASGSSSCDVGLTLRGGATTIGTGTLPIPAMAGGSYFSSAFSTNAYSFAGGERLSLVVNASSCLGVQMYWDGPHNDSRLVLP
jgi:hypothetical protein